jgi:hypothetical protein
VDPTLKDLLTQIADGDARKVFPLLHHLLELRDARCFDVLTRWHWHRNYQKIYRRCAAQKLSNVLDPYRLEKADQKAKDKLRWGICRLFPEWLKEDHADALKMLAPYQEGLSKAIGHRVSLRDRTR